MEEESFIPKEKKLTKVIIIIVIILLVSIGPYVFYQKYYHNSKRVINQDFDKVIKKVDDIKLDYEKYRLNQLINFEIKNEEFDTEFQDIVNNTIFQVIEEIDHEKKINDTLVNAKYQDDKFFNMEIYREQEKNYLYFNDFSYKYFLMEEKSYLKNDIEVNDLKKLLKTFLEILKEEVVKQKLVREPTSITINNHLEAVYNNSLMLKDNDVLSFYQTLVKKVQSNELMMMVLNKLFDNEANDQLNSFLQSLENQKLDYQLSFYTAKNLKQELVSIKKQLLIGDENISFDIDFLDDNNLSIKIFKDEKEIEILLYANEKALNMDIDYQKEKTFLKINFKSTIESLNEVKKKELKESDISLTLSEEDREEIQNKIGENPKLSHFIDVLTNHPVFQKETTEQG